MKLWLLGGRDRLGVYDKHVQAMVFPAVMYGCESWTIKKAGRWRTDAFKFWCWRRLLTLPWTARRLNQSILKEINPEYSLEGLMLKLKFQYLMWRADSLESPWWRRRGKEWDGWMVSLTQWTWVWANSGRCWRTGKPSMLPSMRLQRDMTERLKAATLGVIWKGGSASCLSLTDFHFWSHMSWIIFLSSA